jgi:hypothetical protein
MPRDPGTGVLRLMHQGRRVVDFARTLWRANDKDYPFLYADQDLLNAVLSAEVPADRVLGLDARLMGAIPFGEPRLLDATALRCAYDDGAEPYVVHNILPAKPWLTPMFDGLYSRLLKRCLAGPGLSIEVPSERIPLRFRSGRLAAAERRRVDASVRLRWHAGTRYDRLRARLGLAPRDPVPRP